MLTIEDVIIFLSVVIGCAVVVKQILMHHNLKIIKKKQEGKMAGGDYKSCER